MDQVNSNTICIYSHSYVSFTPSIPFYRCKWAWTEKHMHTEDARDK